MSLFTGRFYREKMPKLETEKVENICNKITIAKRWCILFAYRPPNFSKTQFFKLISLTRNKALNKYDSLLLTRDMNINTLRSTSDSSNHLSDLNKTSILSNLITDSTCFKSNKKTLCVITIAMICSSLASLWKFQYFRRSIYNPVEHLWWSFYCKNSEPLSIFTKKLHNRCFLGF